MPRQEEHPMMTQTEEAVRKIEHEYQHLTEAAPVNTDRLLQFFAYEHLPEHLQVVSKPFGELAAHIVSTLPSNPERTVALRKLLEAKDCAVRALLFK